MSVQNLAREHAWALGLALLASLIVAFPQLYFRIDHADDGIYQGIELLPDSPWSPRAREVLDGHPNFGSIYYKEGKNDPYLFQPLGSMVVGYLGKAFSFDINNTLLLQRLLLTAATFLLLYTFVYQLFGSRLAALSAASLIVLADSVLSVYGLSRLLHGQSPDSFLRIGRPVNPAMIYILLFGFLAPFWQFLKTRAWLWGLLAAFVLGLNFYNYFYSWTYLYAVGGILGLIYLVREDWSGALRVAGVYIGALLVAIPYAVNLYRASMYPTYEEVAARFGVVSSHAPEFVGFLVLGTLALAGIGYVWFGFARENREQWWLCVALLLAPFVTMNQQLITGLILQEAHYHWFFHKPIATIFITVVTLLIVRRWLGGRVATIAASLIIVSSIGTGAFVQVATYNHDFPNRDGGARLIERQRYGPVMQWLNANAQKEEVVLANNDISHLVVIYTPLNVFYHRVAFISLSATRDRLLDVLFTLYRLRGVAGADTEGVFFSERGFISGNLYGEHYRQLTGSYEGIPDEKIQEVVDLYQEILDESPSTWLKRMLETYKVSYVVWDRKNDPAWNLERYGFLVESARFGDLSIYQFTP